MVLAEEDFLIGLEFLLNLVADAQSVSQPKRHRGQPRTVGAGPIGEDRFENAIEFDQRFFVKRNVVDLVDRNARLAEAVFDGVVGEPVVVFFSCKALLLGCGDELPIAHQGYAGVVVVARYSEDDHRWLVQR